MSNKKGMQSLAMLTAISMSLGMDMTGFGMPTEPRLTPESIKRLRELRMQQGLESQKKNKGLKEFNIDGKIVWALNEKNAIRKAKKV
jgi:hypothetical protein